MANLNAYQIKQNEIFFENVINQLKEGGFYVYPDLVQRAKDKEAPFFRKKGNILLCNQEGYDSVKKIVSAKFLLTRFEVKLK